MKNGIAQVSSSPYGIGAWAKGDSAVLIYDRYDVWSVDPIGTNFPILITNGYGRSNKIVFRNTYLNGTDENSAPAFTKNDTLLLCAFNEVSKMNGFFSGQD